MRTIDRHRRFASHGVRLVELSVCCMAANYARTSLALQASARPKLYLVLLRGVACVAGGDPDKRSLPNNSGADGTLWMVGYITSFVTFPDRGILVQRRTNAVTDETDFDRDRTLSGNYEQAPRWFIPGYDASHAMAAVLLRDRIGERGRILVVGAGGGVELSVLARECQGWTFTGVD